jgi:hypothetical protein
MTILNVPKIIRSEIFLVEGRMISQQVLHAVRNQYFLKVENFERSTKTG